MERKYFGETYNKIQYFDKHGEEIQAGMCLRNENGEVQRVYSCGDECGSANLGFMATNPKFLERHPDWPVEYYPLSQYNLAQWEIVKES